jgi:outer membrane autotransporter protein
MLGLLASGLCCGVELLQTAARAQVWCIGNTIVLIPGQACGNITQPNIPSSFTNEGGSAGTVQQGNVVDQAVFRSGLIEALFQGDGRDTFFMSAGEISGAFEDGDVAEMLGGSIGRVNLKLDNNLFEMSGGLILGNLVAGFQNDQVVLAAGRINGSISLSGGIDEVRISGGRVNGDVLMSFGNDRFIWENAGVILGTIQMGPDDDQAWLLGLGEDELKDPRSIDAGAGSDQMIFSNAQAAGLSRFLNWETITLNNNSSLRLDSTLVLGDIGSLTGSLSIDATSTLMSQLSIADVTIRGWDPVGLVTVFNAGVIDLTRSQAEHRLTIQGNFNGSNGQLRLNTVLGDDQSPSDRLVVSGGNITGSTSILINQFGGGGALTTGSGIQVVEATRGATSTATAFALASRVQAGAYEYYLFKGGSTVDSASSWYLRSSLPAAQTGAAPTPTPAPSVTSIPDPPAPQPPSPIPDPAPGPLPPAPTPPGPTPAPDDPAVPVNPQPQPDPSPDNGPQGNSLSGYALTQAAPSLPAAGATAVPIYRMEVPVYGALGGVARDLSLQQVGSFNERLGDQISLRQSYQNHGTWIRGFGGNRKLSWQGGAEPTFLGNSGGLQLGQDLLVGSSQAGTLSRLGLLLGYGVSSGSVKGLAFATPDFAAGSLDLKSYSVGLYGNVISAGNAYLDGVLLGSLFNSRLSSNQGMEESIDGEALSLSVEAGYPITLAPRLTLEPQIQAIAQWQSFQSINDQVSSVYIEPSNSLLGRVGLRLQADFGRNNNRVSPFVRLNLWQQFSGNDATTYSGTTTIANSIQSTALQIGLGVDAKVTEHVSIYLAADYLGAIAGAAQQTLKGNLGLRFRF